MLGRTCDYKVVFKLKMIDSTGFSVSKLLSAIAKSEIDVTYKGVSVTSVVEFCGHESTGAWF